MEELRQTELTVLRETHSEHMNNLVDQLRETEAEVLSLREKLQEAEALKESPPTPSPPELLPSANDTHAEPAPNAGSDRSTKKRQRSMKKRKQKILSMSPLLIDLF